MKKRIFLLFLLVVPLLAIGFSAVRYSDAASLENSRDQIQAGLRKARLFALELNRPVVFTLKNDCNWSVAPQGRTKPVIETIGLSFGKSCVLSNQSDSVTFLADGHVSSKGSILTSPIGIKVIDTLNHDSKNITLLVMGLGVSS